MSHAKKKPGRTRRAGLPGGQASAGGIFQLAFHNSPAMQSVVRASDGMIVEVNDTFLKKLGFAREEVLGKTPFELDFWLEPEKLPAYRRELETKGFVQGHEALLRARDGRILTVLLSTQPVDIGGVLHNLSAGVDITQRKQTEAELRVANERLRQSEERFGKAFHANPVIMAITRCSDGAFVAANESLLRTTGYTEQEVIGRTTMELGLYDDPGEREAFVRRIAEQGFDRNRELSIRARDGHLCTLLVSAEKLDIDGVTHLLTVGLDISERKQAEARLRESERQLRETQARFSTAFHTSPVLMTIARLTDARFVEVNEAFIRHIGLTREEVIGRDSRELGLWVSLEDRAAFFERLSRSKVVRDVEARIRTQRGTIHTMQLSGEIIEINQAPHLITFALDITHNKEAQAELQNALARERELNQLKSDFVSLVSHEFRTPLEIIMSSADNLLRYYARLAPEKREQLLQTINKSVRRMSGMMEEVLLLGRLETDRMTFSPRTVELRVFFQRICDEIESATGKRCPIRLGMEDTPATAIGDENVLRHIFTNLLSNAVKYSLPERTVELAVRRAGDDAVCQVTDHGCGIPEADQKRLFQAFHRGSNVRQVPGTGLGLLIVRRCVELHGGEIRFESIEGQGTTFQVRLPLFGPPPPVVSPALFAEEPSERTF